MAAPERARALHADLVVGGLSRVLRRLAQPVRNTLDDAGIYSGRSLEELFPAPSRVPEVTVTARWRVPGVVSEDLVFDSQHEPLEPKFRRRYWRDYGETHRVYARRIRPASARARPRLLYLHGYMQPETYIEELALLSAMALLLNVEVIQMQPPYHGRRTPRGARFSGELYWTADLVRSVEALRQTLLDARTLLGHLLAEDERPVGISGLSLGGALTLCLTCLEERFAFSVPLIAHMDLAALVSDAPVLTGMRHDLQGLRLGEAGVPRLRREPRLVRSDAQAAGGSHAAHRRLRRSLLRAPRGAQDVDSLGQAGDPLVPDQPHGLPRPPATGAARDAPVHRSDFPDGGELTSAAVNWATASLHPRHASTIRRNMAVNAWRLSRRPTGDGEHVHGSSRSPPSA